MKRSTPSSSSVPRIITHSAPGLRWFTVLTLFLVTISSTTVRAQSTTNCDPNVALTLDFDTSVVTVDNLEQPGGALRFQGIASLEGQLVDLEITVAPGTDYTTTNIPRQGGEFGFINVANRPNDDEQNGTGDFVFCLRDTVTDEEVVAESFHMTIFDLDSRGAIGVEQVRIASDQLATYQLDENTEVLVDCAEDNVAPPACAGGTLRFTSTTAGTGADNPTDPSQLTAQQLQRSILLTFTNRACFRLAFSQLCLVDNCSISGLLNFGGSAQQLATDGVCETAAALPTAAPTRAPTLMPTPDSIRRRQGSGKGGSRNSKAESGKGGMMAPVSESMPAMGKGKGAAVASGKGDASTGKGKGAPSNMTPPPTESSMPASKGKGAVQVGKGKGMEDSTGGKGMEESASGKGSGKGPAESKMDGGVSASVKGKGSTKTSKGKVSSTGKGSIAKKSKSTTSKSRGKKIQKSDRR